VNEIGVNRDLGLFRGKASEETNPPKRSSKLDGLLLDRMDRASRNNDVGPLARGQVEDGFFQIAHVWIDYMIGSELPRLLESLNQRT
jgi:hypothetical protein